MGCLPWTKALALPDGNGEGGQASPKGTKREENPEGRSYESNSVKHAPDSKVPNVGNVPGLLGPPVRGKGLLGGRGRW